jgi:hypothetical protein
MLVSTTPQTLVELCGESMDIEDLKYFLPHASWSIIEEGERKYLTSESLNYLEDNREILAKSQNLLDLLNGCANIIYYDHHVVTLGNLMRIDERGRHHFIMIADTLRIRIRTNAVVVKANGVFEESINNWIELAEQYESVRDALFFFKEVNWWNLYKVFEVISMDISGQHNLYPKYMTRSEYNRFHHTAQSREAIGELARHGKKIPAPAEPMSLNEAYHLIKTTVDKWIGEKLVDIHAKML